MERVTGAERGQVRCWLSRRRANAVGCLRFAPPAVGAKPGLPPFVTPRAPRARARRIPRALAPRAPPATAARATRGDQARGRAARPPRAELRGTHHQPQSRAAERARRSPRCNGRRRIDVGRRRPASRRAAPATALPRSAKHGAPPRVAFSSGSATVTLAVHPLYGQELTVRGAFGRYALWVETPNGQLRIMPLGWTNLGAPRLVQKHRLRAEDLLSLAAWVQDRKVDHFDKWVEGSDPDGRSRRSGRGAPAAKLPVAGDGDRHRGATAVVEQAGSSGPHVRTRRSAERKRGTR